MSDNRKPAVGYIRMSTDQQQDSPTRQRQDINALADRQGFKIIRWYEDHGLTGTESSKRREFQKLLADAKAGTFAAVLVSEQSRSRRCSGSSRTASGSPTGCRAGTRWPVW